MIVQITITQLHVLRAETVETRDGAEISNDTSSKWLLLDQFLSELLNQH